MPPPAELSRLIDVVLSQFGYLGLALLMFVENLVPPLPSELILPLAGYLVTVDRMDLILVLAASTTGSLLGALALYGVGRSVGEERLKALIASHGRRLGFREEAFDRGAAILRRHAGAALFWGRLVPGLRSVISIPAGVVRVPLYAFVAWTLLSSLCWNAALVGAGVVLGENWARVLALMDRYETALWWAAAAALAIAYGSIVILRRHRSAPTGNDGG